MTFLCMDIVLPVAAGFFFITVLSMALVILAFRIHFVPRQTRVVAFFHPHCSAGGGGERVLWKAIQVLGDMQPELTIVVYTIDKEHDGYKAELLRHVQSRFSIAISKKARLSFIHLNEYAHFLEPCQRFSLIGESWGTVKLAYKAMEQCTPCVFFDTTGCAFTYFVARVLAGCRVAAYVHYPTLSTDMLSLVWKRRPSYNHGSDIAKSLPTTVLKLVYYTIFAVAYGCVGSLAHLVMVNSSWTYGHISFLWKGVARRRMQIVFPPCDVTRLINLPLGRRQQVVLSIGQFRPEKDHEMQIRAFSLLLKNLPERDRRNVKLLLIGSCRGWEDERRVERYRSLVDTLGLVEHITFVLNQPYSVVKDWLGQASVGLHTMWNEHFGIGVVEMMAAGLLVVAHNSGGPKEDIVLPGTGFLASSAEEYADCMLRALSLKDDAMMLEMRETARASASRFSDEVFDSSFQKVVLDSGLLLFPTK